jgi:hypothetical protein
VSLKTLKDKKADTHSVFFLLFFNMFNISGGLIMINIFKELLNNSSRKELKKMQQELNEYISFLEDNEN